MQYPEHTNKDTEIIIDIEAIFMVLIIGLVTGFVFGYSLGKQRGVQQIKKIYQDKYPKKDLEYIENEEEPE